MVLEPHLLSTRNKEISNQSSIKRPSLEDLKIKNKDSILAKMAQFIKSLGQLLFKAMKTTNKLILIRKQSLEVLTKDNPETTLVPTDKSSLTLLPSDKLEDCN